MLSSVLLIDDDSTAVFINTLLLNKLAVSDRILVARDGQEALELLHRLDDEAPALIMLDLHMDGMNGLDFLRAYQQLPPRATVLAVVTSSTLVRDLAPLPALGVAAIIEKPLTREKLTGLLHQHFGQQFAAEPTL